MRRSLALAIAGLLGGTAVSACSEDKPAASPTVASSSSSTSPATRSQPTQSTEPTEPTRSAPSNDPVKPVLPDAAKEQSQAGARAFIEHYIAVLNAAYEETEPSLLRPYTPGSCSVCASFLQVLQRVDRQGGSQSGGAWTPSAIDLAARESSDRWIFVTTVNIAPGRSRASRDAPAEAIPRDEIRVEIRLHWSQKRWTLNDVAPI